MKRDYYRPNDPVRFEFPLDGDCLNIRDGEMKNGYLTIKVKVQAPVNADIYIDEQKAAYEDGYYTLEVPLRAYRTTIVAENRTTGYQTEIAVYKLKGCMNKYRISLDDNILFLADITANKDVYKSIFENPYLAVYKKAHDLYGAKVHINLYYEHCDSEADRRAFSGKHEYFNLTMMTDKFKDEWKANSDWLRLSFHARSNFPDRPYRDTTLERISNDIELVHREIRRFAGEDSLAPVTTLHWGASNETGVHALRNHGYKGINGYFNLNKDGSTLVAYHYPADFVKHVNTRDFWVDNVENVVCSKVDIVLNSWRADTVTKKLDEIYAHPGNSGFVEMLIHEQYFYSDYSYHLPDYEQIVLNAAKWCVDHGYTGSFLGDVEFEGDRWCEAPEQA